MCGCSSAVMSPVVCEGGQCATAGCFFLGGGAFCLIHNKFPIILPFVSKGLETRGELHICLNQII